MLDVVPVDSREVDRVRELVHVIIRNDLVSLSGLRFRRLRGTGDCGAQPVRVGGEILAGTRQRVATGESVLQNSSHVAKQKWKAGQEVEA